jgi:transcription elongation factor Elf1
MADNLIDTTEIKETDIVFECPHCGKSLAIDYRGAGLTIPCTDCGKIVQVPIPDGMQIADIDSTVEQQESMIMNLRKSLYSAEKKIDNLTKEIDELKTKHESIDKIRSESKAQFSSVMERITTIQKAVDDIHKAVHKIAEIAKNQIIV